MKTSNGILLGLLVVVFVVPFLLALTLKSKINKGNFVVKKYNNSFIDESFKRSGEFTSYSVVKVSAPQPEVLKCHLKLSDDRDYVYNNYGSKDSITVYTSGDTLYVQYVPKTVSGDAKNQVNYQDLRININLPSFSNLVVDGATVIIDSMPSTAGNLSVILLNNGSVKDGTKNKEDRSSRITSPQQGNGPASATQASASVSRVEKDIIVKTVSFPEFPGVDFREVLLNRLLYRI